MCACVCVCLCVCMCACVCVCVHVCVCVCVVQRNLQEAGYSVMTPVQLQTMPAVLMGRDVLVSATTGSGKSELDVCMCLQWVYPVRMCA